MISHELVASIAALLSALSAVIGLAVALVKAIKSHDAEKVKNLLESAAREAVEFAEKVSGVDGETKKIIALTMINRKFIENNLAYDENEASEAVERLIDLSKEVNADEKITL